MDKKYNKRRVGTEYEECAAMYLESQGYHILERNFRAGRYGEVDIIAKTGDGLLVIFECKYRSDNVHGDPLEAIDWRKQKQICRTTLYYYTRHGYGVDYPCRFDVIAIYGDGTIRHIENAFEFH